MLNSKSTFNLSNIREQFPILKQNIYGKPLVYLDNAATTQKPLSVINSTVDYYTKYNANVHRGTHFLSDTTTCAIEATRKFVQKFINAEESSEIVFTKGTTESINLVAECYAKKFLEAGDEVIISGMEHHSNILPWQVVCKEKKALLKIIPITKEGTLDLNDFERLLSRRTKIVSIIHVSNVLGTINPVKDIISLAKKYGAVVMLDSAQALAHMPIDVQDLNCDFLAASAHKVYGPTGVGILYAKREFLEQMDPYQVGGGMVNSVNYESFIPSEIPFKFEAGTLNIAGIFAFQSALKFISDIGFEEIQKHESSLRECLLKSLSSIDRVSIIGQSCNRSAIVSFAVSGMHHLDIGLLLDANGIAVRSGNLCAQPIMNFFGIPGVLRVSCAVYNTEEEILRMSENLCIMLLGRIK